MVGGGRSEMFIFILFVCWKCSNGRNINYNTWHLKKADSPGYFVWFIIVFCICGGPQVSTRNYIIISIFLFLDCFIKAAVQSDLNLSEESIWLRLNTRESCKGRYKKKVAFDHLENVKR